MTQVVEVTREALIVRREEILARVGAGWDEFAERARSFSLVGDEWDAWDAIEAFVGSSSGQ